MYINEAVGKGAKNIKNDVAFAQEILHLISTEDMRIPCIEIDGSSGPKTESAIYHFQKYIVKLTRPDSRIDPNGRSEKALIAKAVEIDKDLLPTLAKKYAVKRQASTQSGAGPRIIKYRTSAKKVLSKYTENIIKLAMSYGNINQCDISSTYRSFNDQARIMYDNANSFPAATTVAGLRTLRRWGYGANGRAVEAIYFENKSKSRKDVIELMEKKVKSLNKAGQVVSRHCVSEAAFNKRNVLDIPYSSVPPAKRVPFEKALMGMSTKVSNARYASPSKGVQFITRLIIENKCWHIEIEQNNKPLPNTKKPAAPVIRYNRRPAIVQKQSTWSFFGNFLDDWF